jgi:hypothetical protein
VFGQSALSIRVIGINEIGEMCHAFGVHPARQVADDTRC